MQLTNKILKNQIKGFIALYFIILSFELLINLESDRLMLYWPAHNILPIILNKKIDLLNFDFFTTNYRNSPQIFLSNIYSKILPEDHLEILSIFSIAMIYIKSFVNSIQIFIAVSIFYNIKNLFKKQNKSIPPFNYLGAGIVYNAIIFIPKFVYLLPNNFSKLISFLYYLFLQTPLLGVTIAGFSFPLSIASSRGISLSISLLTVSFPIILNLYHFKIERKINFVILSICFILNFLATLIHPVSPLTGLIIILIYHFSSLKIGLFYRLKLFYIVNISSYILGLIILIYNFPQSPIDNNIFFQSYVVLRHPHHYLPSFYLLNKDFLLNFFISATIVLIILISNRIIFRKDALNRLLIGASFLAFALNLIQFLFVEILNINIFIKYGLSSLSFIFNLFYTISFIYFLNLFIHKKNYLPKFKLFFRRIILIINDVLIKKIIFLLLTIIMILSISCFNLNFIKIQNSWTKQLSNFMSSSDYSKTSQILIDKNLRDRFIFPREIGGLNIFFDDYFPFTTESISEWQERYYEIENLKECINSTSLICTIRSQNNVFYVTDKIEEKFSNNIQSFKINNKKFFIQEINNSN